MKTLILPLLLFLVPLNAMNIAQTSSQAAQSTRAQNINKETAWLVHVSRLFPQDGTLVAGMLGKLSFGKEGTLPEFEAEDIVRKRTIYYLSCVRNTVHWSVNSMVYPHQFITKNALGKEVSGKIVRDDFSYGILEPMHMFQDKHIVGLWQDVFHLGSHTLSNQSIIFVPAQDTSFEVYKGSFAGTIRRYEGSLRTAIEDFLRSKNVSIVYPAYKGQKAAEIDQTEAPDAFVEGTVFTCAEGF